MSLDLEAIKLRLAEAAIRGHLTRLQVECDLIDTDVPALVAEVERLRDEVERRERCAFCDGIADQFIMMVGLCYRHSAETLLDVERLQAELEDANDRIYLETNGS